MSKKYLNKAIIVLLLIAVFVSSTVLFNHYFSLDIYAKIGSAPYYDDFAPYYSDFPIHFLWAKAGKSISLLGPYLGFVNLCFDSTLAVAIAMALVIMATIVTTYYFMQYIVKSLDFELSKTKTMYLSISGMFLCSIWIPYIFQYLYNFLTISTQPWHNPTYMLMKPIAVLALILSFKMLKDYRNNPSFWQYALYSIVLSLCNFAKASFVVVYGIFIFVFCLIELISSKGKSFWPAIKLGICFVISAIPLLYQKYVLFEVLRDNAGITINLTKYFVENGRKNALIAIFAGLAFPIFATVYLKIKSTDIKNLKFLKYAWILFAISYAERVFVFETGIRASHGNFAWGMIFFAYILYIVCLVYWEYGYKSGIIKSKKIYLLGYSLYSLNVICGIVYYILLQTGKFYRIF